MIKRHYFKSGTLSLPLYFKPLQVSVEMFVEVIEDDPFAVESKLPTKEFVNGVKITGELSFEFPFYDKVPVTKDSIGKLGLLIDDKGASFNLVFLEKTGETDVIPKKLKKYFWSFLPVGNPAYDRLDIFPVQYKQPTKANRIYYWVDSEKTFLVVAPDKKTAKELIEKQVDGPLVNLKELDTNNPNVLILGES